jgi:hypothetical protein
VKLLNTLSSTLQLKPGVSKIVKSAELGQGAARRLTTDAIKATKNVNPKRFVIDPPMFLYGARLRPQLSKAPPGLTK